MARVARPCVLRIATSVGVAVVATTLAACSGGNDASRLSRSAFNEKANAACATLLVAGNELFSESTATATGPAVAELLGTAADRLRDVARAVGKLQPPEALDEDVDTLVERITQYADGLDDLAKQAEPGQSLADVQSENAAIVRKLNRISDRIDTLIGQLGLTGCASL